MVPLLNPLLELLLCFLLCEFSKTCAVQELLVRKYLEHPQYLEVKKSKRKDDRKRQRETDSQKKYADYN